MNFKYLKNNKPEIKLGSCCLGRTELGTSNGPGVSILETILFRNDVADISG
jgi:hypothetical protein